MRFYFHLQIGPVFIRDHEGTELADEVAAREHARKVIGSVSQGSTVKRQSPLQCAVIVEDGKGPRFRVPFAAVQANAGSSFPPP